MLIRRQREFWCGVVFVAAGLGFAWSAGTWPLGHRASPGPGFLGLCLALALTMVGALVLFMATTIEVAGGDPFGPFGARPVTLVLLALGLFGLALPRAGLVPTVLASSLLLELALAGPGAGASAPPRRGWVPIVVAARGRLTRALAAAGLAWVMCHLVLKLRLPLWPLPLAAWFA